MSIISAFPGGGAAKYIHSKTGTAHSFTGAGKLGFAILTADYADGDSISVNGTAMTVVGDPDALVTDGSVLFSIDGSTMYLYEVANPFVIPDGETVTPVNDVETWLACAGVRYESVDSPDLATTVASETLMTTLVNSDNAMAYLIRSTTIQEAVYGSAAAIAALDASTPFVSQYMTSNSAPAGYTASATNTSGSGAYAPFMLNGDWYGSVGKYAQINLPTAIWPYKVTGNLWTNGTYNTWYIQGSADGNTWTTIRSAFNGARPVAVAMSAGTTQKMSHFRLYVNSCDATPLAGSIQFHGKE